MVVVEVPLWVAHSSENVSSSSDGVGLKEDKHEKRAMESLALLEGLGGTQKCAIYSIDVHPEGKKFATGGGDGTVRIWNAEALFANTRSKSQYKEGGAYASSGESSVEENSNGATTAADEGSMSESSVGDAVAEDIVHDLSNLVRRKKGGAAGTPNKKPEESNQFPGASPPSKHSHHHQSHHQHRLLCTLSAHTGSSVLALRFSTNGQYLASAGDDAAVCIYSPASNTALSKGNLDNSVEHWTRIKLGRGHALDVVGLAWAPDDSHLVSCSLDSNAPIIVWKLTDLATSDHHPTQSNVLINPYKILGKGIHTSTVKGVTFDPAGTYLASSGDDPSVCVWRAHDDWGLEKRIDANSGIFRRWNETDAKSLTSQSLFRRLSWSTDGAYICSTNAVVKNKHVASTISREGWAVSNAKSTASGAANLVGHKQPVVAARHCPQLLDAREKGDDGEDDEPDYATIVALGDKRGFVTVWSTRQTRPIFKIQCSETRCTVTDLAWGRAKSDIVLLVSLLDGQIVAIRFAADGELGKILTSKDQARVFQLRYGIDFTETEMGRRRLFVGDNAGPKLIENSLQFALEEEQDSVGDEDEVDLQLAGTALEKGNSSMLSSTDIKATQNESRSKGGKKRIQPLLMSVDEPLPKIAKVSKVGEEGGKKKVDTVEGAIELAEKAASGAEAAVATQTRPDSSLTEAAAARPEGQNHPMLQDANASQSRSSQLWSEAQASSPKIAYSTDRVHSVDLPVVLLEDFGDQGVFTADCTNSIQTPLLSKGSAVACTTLTISRSGQLLYKDQIPGTSCSAIAASKNFVVVGTTDGCIQLYGTSPTLGWKSGQGFRSHPPFVIGQPVVALKLWEPSQVNAELQKTELLVLSADGSFGVYSLDMGLRIRFKGSVLPPMSHMVLSSGRANELHPPRLARIQLTDNCRVFLLLSLVPSPGHASNGNSNNQNVELSFGAGGSLQAFLYDPNAELWMRVADSRFVLSDFYTTLPTLNSKKKVRGALTKLEDIVKIGASGSTLKPSSRGRAVAADAERSYHHASDSGSDIVTRSHCEDRMACAIALESQSEFEYWLSLYARILSLSGDEPGLRLLVDMLNGKSIQNDLVGNDCFVSCWWLTKAPRVLSLSRVELIKTCVISEMSKNRALQRLTNEISLETNAMANL